MTETGKATGTEMATVTPKVARRGWVRGSETGSGTGQTDWGSERETGSPTADQDSESGSVRLSARRDWAMRSETVKGLGSVRLKVKGWDSLKAKDSLMVRDWDSLTAKDSLMGTDSLKGKGSVKG